MTALEPRTVPGCAELAERYDAVRALTERLASPLSPEDQSIQSAPEVSPTKWHRAHTSWFFETFVLAAALADYREFHPRFGYLFNSYYNTVGAQFPRNHRGVISRPGASEITEYRTHVDSAMHHLLGGESDAETLRLVELGLNHEQQHQELLLMDIKHVLSCNPLRPGYTRQSTPEPTATPPLTWSEHPGGFVEVGHDGVGFAYDNEQPRHQAWLHPFALASRPVTNGEWLEFIDNGGYRRPELWLSDGWATVQSEGWHAPLYWEHRDGEWQVFTLSGTRPVNAAEPVCHISYYEADAYARWAGARLPTEFEWEAVAADQPLDGRLLDPDRLHPRAAPDGRGPRQMFGDVWEWTGSAYLPYPGYQPPAGAIGEYNGKFMVNQHVLRGGCFATPPDHMRATYRNFFPPAARWMFAGMRLARPL
ncbi:ergothioneine biosynthesis protein EgtB [Haloechinothrix sp. LS1_15]|uniref:ergothioneine biosynthesis protein EgtB n=1 Tax=Haloechinothrix sp. LS1_15 TaxID=2652248 RepID=UPI0029453843|nr:ergothioneine biosynthesis protein EgtB [Haloechinothrix sp. LS1_15]MDV6011055.1 ergothioneine biosynthesis protein EgtB [Haloechinothrix sp. LS1_15]